ncbi:MAG: HlyD family efflux transporter periplasmic adaptor subunit [Candidatus Palauibacterales bacterium]|nr:HlyD family efflux transporter periplasmic adaptor subunit [Candidatus Palauibacterales bacterium]MDP2584357.1 HlyD family efflux transporter periplasmic adaptor subunit [Candidatus Palauibacterales bacterium]
MKSLRDLLEGAARALPGGKKDPEADAGPRPLGPRLADDADSGRSGRRDPRDRPSAVAGSRMDVAREPTNKRRRYILIGAAAVAVVIVISVVLSRLGPAAPSVDRDSILTGTVQRGDMTISVRGPGTLVPEHIHYISALTAGRVDRVHVQAGETVDSSTVVLELSNPDVDLAALQAEQQWTSAQGGLVELQRTLGSQKAAQASAVASARATWLNAQREARVDSALAARQLIARNDAERVAEQADAARAALDAAKEQLDLLARTMENQLSVQRELVARLKSIYEYQERRVASMKVTAGGSGILQDLTLQPGQWVQSGTALARVAQPGSLKAQIDIPQSQIRDVQLGQRVLVDLRTDTVPGSVSRIDPNVQQGAVQIDVHLGGDLPRAARPDLSVDGTVIIDHLTDVLHVDRPTYGEARSTVGLFKLVDGGHAAVRVPVKLGRASVDEVEVLSGLQAGDEVILSDMSRYGDVDRVKLK